MNTEAWYLELSEDNGSHKFYEVTLEGADLTIRYGRIGCRANAEEKLRGCGQTRVARNTQPQTFRLERFHVLTPQRSRALVESFVQEFGNAPDGVHRFWDFFRPTLKHMPHPLPDLELYPHASGLRPH